MQGTRGVGEEAGMGREGSKLRTAGRARLKESDIRNTVSTLDMDCTP